MLFFEKFRYDILKSLPVIISSVLIAWCGFYLLFGASSIFTLRLLKVQEAKLEKTANNLALQRKDVESRVVRMRPDTLDWDLVEEQAHVKLGTSPLITKSLKM
jgi:cell division protein FtsB